MNNVILIGRLTKTPELRYTQTGLAVARFSLAVDRKFAKKNDTNSTTTDFFNVVVFGKMAENMSKYLQKGKLVCVKGRLQNDNYTDKDGIKHYNVDIITEEIQFLQWGDKKSSDSAVSKQAQDSKPISEDDLGDDELEFLDDEDVSF